MKRKVLMIFCAVVLGLAGAGLTARLIAPYQSVQFMASLLSAIPLGALEKEIPGLPREKNVICFHMEEVSDSMLKVTIRARQLNEKILGVGFTFLSLPSAVTFHHFTAGDFLERGGTPLYVVQDTPSRGLIVGATLKRGDRLQSGSGTLLTFFFQRRSRQDPAFSLTRTVVSTLLQNERKNITRIVWRRCGGGRYKAFNGF